MNTVLQPALVSPISRPEALSNRFHTISINSISLWCDVLRMKLSESAARSMEFQLVVSFWKKGAPSCGSGREFALTSHCAAPSENNKIDKHIVVPS